MKPKFKKRKGENLSETRRQGPRGPTVPVSSFLSIERWTRQRAATEREVWTNRQTAEGKKVGAGRETGKQRDKQRTRQTKGPSAWDRQTGERKPTEALVQRVSGWTHEKGCLRLSLSVRVSGAFRPLGPHLSIFLGMCVLLRPLHALSLTLQSPQPCPIPVAPSVPGHLSDLPITRPLREIQTLPVGFGRLPQEPGQSSRDGQDRQGLQLGGGQLPGLQEGKSSIACVPMSGQA